MKIQTLNLEPTTGYKTQTTFMQDFSIADHFGIEAVKDTFNRAFKEWKDNYVYLTELAIVTNLRCWYWYDNGDNELSKVYADLYYTARNYALDTLSGEEFQYYYKWTD